MKNPNPDCSLNKDCFNYGMSCKNCCFSVAEIERRKALPLVLLPNGLWGKKVGKEKPYA